MATEKAGIVKEGGVAVVREQRPEAMAVIERRCDQVGAELVLEGKDFGLLERTHGVGGQALSMRGRHATYDEVFLPLLGEQLARNAGAAVTAVESLVGRALEPAAVRSAFAAVTSPGRLEVVRRRPVVVLDGAHNPDAADSLASALSEAFSWNRLHLVVGMFRDKDVESVLRLLAPLADAAYACMNSSPRSAPPERLEAALADAGVTDVRAFDTVGAAVGAALASAEEDDLVLVTGSFYTVADARPLFVKA